jgi:glucose dehydrogenase
MSLQATSSKQHEGKKTGKQFVAIAAGGGNKYNKTYGDALVAFALPTPER